MKETSMDGMAGDDAPGAPTRRAAALSVDVEDYYQVWAFEDLLSRSDWPKWPSRVAGNTRRLLDLFAEAGVRATFFVLGCVAEAEPEIVRAIAEAGHEVGSHGWAHVSVERQTPDEFREDVRRTRLLLEDAAGAPVIGYRAANFSIGPATPWAHDVLAETGHRYSSSVNPIAHDHYGDPTAPLGPFVPVGGGLLEIPVAAVQLAGRRLPCGGGGWFRIAPYRLFRLALRRASARGAPVFYIHPWEIDPGQPRFAAARPRARFRHYANLATTEAKLKRLLSDFQWDRIDRLFLEGAADVAAAAHRWRTGGRRLRPLDATGTARTNLAGGRRASLDADRRS